MTELQSLSPGQPIPVGHIAELTRRANASPVPSGSVPAIQTRDGGVAVSPPGGPANATGGVVVSRVVVVWASHANPVPGAEPLFKDVTYKLWCARRGIVLQTTFDYTMRELPLASPPVRDTLTVYPAIAYDQLPAPGTDPTKPPMMAEGVLYEFAPGTPGAVSVCRLFGESVAAEVC